MSINAPNINALLCNGPIGCANGSGDQVDPLDTPELPAALGPTDRAQTYNGPFEECPVEEVDHPVQT